MNTQVLEDIKIAFAAVRGQLLRSILTIVIIVFGITSLVGTLTCIDAIKASLNSNFALMGSNTFTIRNREMNIRIGKGGKGPKRFESITYDDAQRFAEEYEFPSKTSVSTFASGTARLKYESKKSNPNIQVMAGDENYLAAAGYELGKGRNFSFQDIQLGNHVVIIGKDIISTLFEKNVNPVDKIITIGSGKYRIIGVLEPKGSSMSFGGDKICIIPLNNARQYFPRPDMSFTVSVLVENAATMETGIGEATGLLRKIRGLRTGEENNFDIIKSDALANQLDGLLKNAKLVAAAVGIITLLGAAIGLMNIMLVSVSERTREIGIRKAVGAPKKAIVRQFLVESILICQLGGFFGIIVALLAGNILSFSLGAGFIVPWAWILLGVVVCFVVGLASGIYPAIKASKLDPIEALRFE